MRISVRISAHFWHRAGVCQEWPHFCASSASPLSADYDDDDCAHFSKDIRGMMHICAYLRIMCIAPHATYA